MSQHLLSALNSDHPFAIHPGRIVADMLIVAAGELRDPMAFVIRVVSVNWLFHEVVSYRSTNGFVKSRNWRVVV